MKDFAVLEQQINYSFKDINKLKIALTHSSYANELQTKNKEYNERYEFLGDAVLELAVSDYLFNKYKDYPEGKLTKTRASIVCEQTLFSCAQIINLGEFLLLGKGEERSGGRKRPSVVSDAMEALIGAIYLDSGKDNAFRFINEFILKHIDELELFFDCKTSLQEIVQGKFDKELKYVLVKEEGPDHDKIFITEVLIGDECLGVGEGRTKKASEQDAAYKALKKIKH